MAKTTHIAKVPSPWFSNFASSLEFCKRLVHLHPDFHVTLILPNLESPPLAFKSSLHTLPSNIDPILLPPIHNHEMPPGLPPYVQMKLAVSKSLPHVQQVLKSLSSKFPLSALITDSFAIEALDFAKQLNSMSFVYIVTCATALSAFLHIPKLDEITVSGEFRDIPEAIQIPGCVHLHGIDLPEPVQNRSSPAFKQFLQLTKTFQTVDGFIVNSILEMEEDPVKAFKENRTNQSIYLVGPITKTESNSKKEEEGYCLKWLEKQPEKSVLYVSFGGGGALSQEQTNELALGLEQSRKRFLWVMRAPSNSVNVGLSSANEDPLRFLPEGYLERTKERGLIVPLWAPQVQILSHGSIGGFLTHCGWNSVIESVMLGVPLIAWPLFAEQRLNAVMLTNRLKVALWAQVNENGIVVKEEISKVVKSLMEGEEGKEIYKRMT